MPGCPAGNEKYPLDFLQIFAAQIDLGQFNDSGLQINPPANRIDNCLRLFKNLLEHEMAIPALLGHGRTPLNRRDLFVYLGPTGQGVEGPAGGSQHRQLHIFKENNLLGKGQEGGDI